MLDRIDLEPLFFAPFVSSVMRVEPAWIDYNGHLNMAYYNVLFDRCVDEAYDLLGIGHDYLKASNHSTFTAEAHEGSGVALHASLRYAHGRDVLDAALAAAGLAAQAIEEVVLRTEAGRPVVAWAVVAAHGQRPG